MVRKHLVSNQPPRCLRWVPLWVQISSASWIASSATVSSQLSLLCPPGISHSTFSRSRFSHSAFSRSAHSQFACSNSAFLVYLLSFHLLSLPLPSPRPPLSVFSHSPSLTLLSFNLSSLTPPSHYPPLTPPFLGPSALTPPTLSLPSLALYLLLLPLCGLQLFWRIVRNMFQHLRC